MALFLLLCGCNRPAGRMERPEDPHGPFSRQIEVGQHVLQQYENWSDRAEWEVVKTSDGWMLTAWRVEHPDRKGAERYLPWGYSTIELDYRMVAIHYNRKG